MSGEVPVVVNGDCSNLRQGDVVALDSIPIPGEGGGLEVVGTPGGVAVISQTCDVVQASKLRCLVAPVLKDATEEDLVSARKGRKPLHLFLGNFSEDAPSRVADMEFAVSIPKACLHGKPILARDAGWDSASQARAVAWRVGRAFSRFAFPDEVYPAFAKLRSKAQSKAGTHSSFGWALDQVQELRVGADQWANKGRFLTLYVILSSQVLIPVEEVDPNWSWGPDRVKGIGGKEVEDRLELDRVCELIRKNFGGDPSTVANLWRIFGARLQDKLLAPALDDEVVEFEVAVVSDVEMCLQEYRATESLDLEVLSFSTA